MLLQGNVSFPASPQLTFELLTDTEVLTRAMPGLKSLAATSDAQYQAVIEIGVAGIKGTYDGKLEMRDIEPGKGYRLVVNGEGPMGFMEGDIRIDLQENASSGTALTYKGEACVGGKVAGVEQRVLSGVAKLLINQFFNGLLKEAKKNV